MYIKHVFSLNILAFTLLSGCAIDENLKAANDDELDVFAQATGNISYNPVQCNMQTGYCPSASLLKSYPPAVDSIRYEQLSTQAVSAYYPPFEQAKSEVYTHNNQLPVSDPSYYTSTYQQHQISQTYPVMDQQNAQQHAPVSSEFTRSDDTIYRFVRSTPNNTDATNVRQIQGYHNNNQQVVISGDNTRTFWQRLPDNVTATPYPQQQFMMPQNATGNIIVEQIRGGIGQNTMYQNHEPHGYNNTNNNRYNQSYHNSVPSSFGQFDNNMYIQQLNNNQNQMLLPMQNTQINQNYDRYQQQYDTQYNMPPQTNNNYYNSTYNQTR